MFFNASFFWIVTSVVIFTASILQAQCYEKSDCPRNLVCENGECIKPSSGGETLGEDENSESVGGYDDEPSGYKVTSKKSGYSGFKSGTQFITPGFLYANSLVGVEYEVGLNRVLGL